MPGAFSDRCRALAAACDAILPPVEVLAGFRALSAADARLERTVLGVSVLGNPIELFTWTGGSAARGDVVLYGFPDPGEAVGATGLLALLDGLARGETWLEA